MKRIIGVVSVAALAFGIVSVLTPVQAKPRPGGQFCGGITGAPCPEGFTCVDDPRDDCNPKTGGRDCSGICVR